MFSLNGLIERLSKVDLSRWISGVPDHELGNGPDWVENFLGFKENNIQNISYDIETGVLTTPKGAYQAGWFVCPSIREISLLVDLLGKQGILKKGRPTVLIKKGVSIGPLVVDGPPFGIYQGASRANGLEFLNGYRGITPYAHTRTQGPSLSATAGPAAFVKTYYVTQQLGRQFNGLGDLGINHQDGYIIWGNEGQNVYDRLNGNINDIRIPAMLYTQVVGATRNAGGGNMHHQKKLVHHIYAYSAPLGCRGNGKGELDRKITQILLTASYIGTIGLGLILNAWDSPREVKNSINLTLVGGGVFGNNTKDIAVAIREAIDFFGEYECEIIIHDYDGKGTDTLRGVGL